MRFRTASKGASDALAGSAQCTYRGFEGARSTRQDRTIKSRLATLLAGALCCVPAPAAQAADTHGPDAHALDAGAPAASAARLAPWCGSRRRSDLPAGRSAPFRYHAVYLVPADGRSRFRSVAPRLQADALDASGLLERLYGRAIRFDMGTACGRTFLDISELRLRATQAQLRAAARSRDPNAIFDLVRAEMRGAGYRLTRERDSYVWRSAGQTVNYVAWLDGPAPAGTCGQATSLLDRRRVFTNANNLGGKLALVFRRGSGFCGADTVRHEIGHNLGALQPQAPNTRDGAHCTDAVEDTMCEPDAPSVARGAGARAYFDYGNDDYWDPPLGRPLPWWTVNLSWFLCRDTRCNGA